MSTYILIHGAWHGAWCWEKVIPLLEKQGHTVYAPDLPGHGEDKASILGITLQNYVDCLCKLIDKINEPVILVGHSFAGIIITQVGEYRHQKIQALIYIAAFLPQDGQSMMTVSKLQPPSRFVKLMKHEPQNNAFYFPFNHIKDFAYHLCDDETVEKVVDRLCIEPLAPVQTPTKLTKNFDSIPRKYIQCTEDNAIYLSTQLVMCEKVPCQVFQLACDHSPFYSAPEALVKLLQI